jgi:hypothetical protein
MVSAERRNRAIVEERDLSAQCSVCERRSENTVCRPHELREITRRDPARGVERRERDRRVVVMRRGFEEKRKRFFVEVVQVKVMGKEEGVEGNVNSRIISVEGSTAERKGQSSRGTM